MSALVPFSARPTYAIKSNCHINQTRSYAVRINKELIQKIDFTKQKVQTVKNFTTKTSLPTHLGWNAPNAIKIIPTSKKFDLSQPAHFFVGGLPALMQAARKLDKLGPNSKERVIFANDEEVPKTLQSGHQGHVHPSEWTADDCSIFNLTKTLLKGMGLIKKSDPADLKHYSYLHFPISLKNLASHPIANFKLYSKFFWQRIVHNLSSVHGVSENDRWLCECVKKSLAFHKELSDKIEAETGQPTFKQGFRVYWSPNREAIEKKKAVWRELGIKCEFMSKEEIMAHTLLKADELFVLKIWGDGKFYPETPTRIIEYLKKHYPNFTYYKARLSELHLEEKSEQPIAVQTYNCDSQEEEHMPITSFFGSPGHNEVFRYEPTKDKWRRLWDEVPVSGTSNIWQCTVSRKEMEERFDQTFDSNEDLIRRIRQLVASANLSNLHTTTWDCEIDGDQIIFQVRATQGANFNSLVADNDDLENMRNNLDRYFIGDWELLSTGTCSRKTWVSNVPEFQNGFLHGLSGIGYSFSATPFEDLKHP